MKPEQEEEEEEQEEEEGEEEEGEEQEEEEQCRRLLRRTLKTLKVRDAAEVGISSFFCCTTAEHQQTARQL